MNSNVMTFLDSEKEMLRLYCRACDDIVRTRFVKDLSKQDNIIRIWKNQDGEWENYFPVYDEDDYRSFMLAFRKLIMDKEMTHIYRVLNIISKLVSDDDRNGIIDIRKSLKKMERGFGFNLGTEDNPDIITVSEACKVIFNADLFHSAIDEQWKLDKLKTFEPFLRSAIIKYVSDFCRQAIAVSEVIKARGYLEKSISG